MDINNLTTLLGSESGETANQPQPKTRKWGPEQYHRRRIVRTVKVSINARVIPEARAKLERMADAAQVTLSEMAQTIIMATDE